MRITRHIAGPATALALAAFASCAHAATLIWPESRQPVPNGGEVGLWEDFHLDPGPMAIPCQATPPSTVVVNGQPVDEVRQQGTPTWSECGEVVVTGGWVAIGFTQPAMKAVAVPAITLAEPDGCRYELHEIEGHENELVGFASWTVSGSATVAAGVPSSPATCATTLPLTGTVELMGPQSGGFGVMPWGSPEASGGEGGQAAEELGERMVTATRLANLGRLFPSGPAAKFSATRAGTLTVYWYAQSAATARRLARSAKRMLVARGTASFAGSGTRRVRVTPTALGRRLLRRHRHVALSMRASFAARGSDAVVVTGSSSTRG
jgi:hypothetical protein